MLGILETTELRRGCGGSGGTLCLMIRIAAKTLAIAAARISRQEAPMGGFETDAVVIGAGAVGLAVARQLSLSGHDVVILEKNEHFGMETSARNSEVIHAGIYYPPGSLKANLCARGKALLYEFCGSHGVPHRRIGKLIVGHHGQDAQLAAIAQAAADNGVNDLRPLARAEIAALEPEISADLALLSPSTGIVDSHQYMLALLGDRTIGAQRGCHRRPAQRRWLAADRAQRWRRHRAGRDDRHQCRRPLGAKRGAPDRRHARYPATVPGQRQLRQPVDEEPLQRLVYPVPEPGGLGVHVTLDMGGALVSAPMWNGWITPIRPPSITPYRRRSLRKFTPLIARWWPSIREEMLTPDYAGVRPKLVAKGAPNADFRIDGPSVHGLPGLVNLFGIESPGLTASLAIAEHVEDLLS